MVPKVHGCLREPQLFIQMWTLKHLSAWEGGALIWRGSTIVLSWGDTEGILLIYPHWSIKYRISLNNSRGWLLIFFAEKGGNYSREAIISNIADWKSCPKYYIFSFPLNKKIITSNKLNMGFLIKCSKFSSLSDKFLELESPLISFSGSHCS